MNKLIIVITISVLLLTGCFNSIDYKDLLFNELDEIYSLEKTKQLYAIRFETELRDNINSDNKYINAWFEFLPKDLIKIDSAVTIYQNDSKMRLFGEFAFMENYQAETYKILGSYGLDFDIYIEKDDGIYFRSWAFRKMHQHFGIEESFDYTDNFIQIYGPAVANEILDTYKKHKTISENISSWEDILLNEDSTVEDESATYNYELDINTVKDNLNLGQTELSNSLSTLFNITDWKVKYTLIKERLDNSTFILSLNESPEVTDSIFNKLNLEMSRYVYSYDDAIDPR